MSKRRLRDWLQNLLLLLLTLTALLLLSRLLQLHVELPGQVQAALNVQTPLAVQPTREGSGVPFPPVHLVVTGDIEYGRYGQLYAVSDDPLLRQGVPLFQEALGSASEAGEASDGAFQAALDAPGVYMDFTVPLPLAVVAVWLGEDAGFDQEVRAMALTAEKDAASLFLLDGEGGIFRCDTALPASAVRALCGSVAPNGGGFAYEAGYGGLEPYSVLVAQAPAAPDVEAALPAGYSAYNLLTALDFNAHTNYRYTETSSGVEVVEESPQTMRIGPDGTVGYSSGEAPRAAGSLPQALDVACALAEALTGGTGAAPLYLRAVEETETGWRIRFQYQAEGIPVLFADEGDALSVLASGGRVDAFTYRCRSYTPVEDEDTPGLLPPAMAAAIAAGYPEGRVSIGYVDAGTGRIRAQWLAK